MQGIHAPDTDHFPTDTAGLPAALEPETIDVGPGEEVTLAIGPVAKRLGDAQLRMLAYNGSIPGPTLKVQQGSEITVHVLNDGDLEATVHWHGLRLENRYDGTHETQDPMEVGEKFTYRIQFPDPGVYWYHPHIREDYGQELGLYGNILVTPADPDYWPPANREITLTLDDVLIEDGRIAPFSRTDTTYVAMGRFGNTLLVRGEADLALTAHTGEVVRFYLTNTANTRVFNVGFEGARMKLVGGDSGRVEHEEFVEAVLLAPSERAVVDVLFEGQGAARLVHTTPDRRYELATIDVGETPAEPSHADAFAVARTNPDMVAERERLSAFQAAPADKTIAFIAEMDMGTPEGAVVYVCPMHPDVVSAEEGSCPKCGMKLLASAVESYACPMHPEVVSESSDARCPRCGMKLVPAQFVSATSDSSHAGHEHHEHGHHGHEHEHHHDHAASGGIEWEDDMVEVNKLTTPANTRWKIVDRSTGAANHAIDWHFRVGDRVKIRLVNEMDSDHPMHHPFHIHGAGRFLVLSRDGVEEQNLVWKDTVLVRTGETVDILLEVTNPGVWMAHCHIAEHHESGMMFSFHVTDPSGSNGEGR